MFAKTAIISTLAALAVAAPAPVTTSRAANPDVFGLISTRSGDQHVHLRAVQANGQRFYLNEASSAFCPASPDIDCANYGNSTAFAYSPDYQTLGLATSVPGGQQVYVTAEGELAYTIAHSASTGVGSFTSPFQYTAQSTENTVGSLTFQGKDFFACQTEGEVYQIFAEAVGTRTGNCIGVSLASADFTGETAYQY